ncbi:hypothetical protein DCAR_0625130 [Daucus carota subsp. sativus]|uniref:Uncharacterized protein n=1 Tax=Daucus carota subsp. sativus TaxID=79200 RepID=A0A161ZWM2_DAUCS|nr:hypothetical protein DCAR_0625130 [Daucus carota subsp. sativus]
MCYVGKATKIFLFLLTAAIITALFLGFRHFRRSKSHNCTSDVNDDLSCHLTASNPPPQASPSLPATTNAPPPATAPPPPVLVTPAPLNSS